jgi:hypothetical protein
MSDKENVVEVDFERLDRLSDVELLTRVRDGLVKVEDGLRGVRAAAAWETTQLGWERHRRRQLQKELLEARRHEFPFKDEAVLDALRSAYDGEPVFATAVAEKLLDDPTLSAKIRTGFALSRLAAAGRVEKISPPLDSHGWRSGRSCRWTPLGAPDG